MMSRNEAIYKLSDHEPSIDYLASKITMSDLKEFTNRWLNYKESNTVKYLSKKNEYEFKGTPISVWYKDNYRNLEYLYVFDVDAIYQVCFASQVDFRYLIGTDKPPLPIAKMIAEYILKEAFPCPSTT